MTNRSGSGSAELRTIAEELAELRKQLARGKNPPEAEEERLRMGRELAAIHDQLRRLGTELGVPDQHLPG